MVIDIKASASNRINLNVSYSIDSINVHRETSLIYLGLGVVRQLKDNLQHG